MRGRDLTNSEKLVKEVQYVLPLLTQRQCDQNKDVRIFFTVNAEK